MKFSSAISILAATMVNFAKANYSHVNIHVGCKGVNFHALSEVEQEFSSYALMMSYNQVHQISDDGDGYLADITAEDPEAMMGR